MRFTISEMSPISMSKIAWHIVDATNTVLADGAFTLMSMRSASVLLRVTSVI